MVGAVTEAEFSAIVAKCRTLPPAKGNYFIDDYIENLLLTVLDFQLHTIAVERAMQHYGLHQREAIRTHHNLEGLLARHPDTREGNLQVAQLLWGYNLWSRVELLRRLVAYLEANGVTTQANLQAWASRTDFKEFDGKVKGAGLAIFKWLTMRLGVETMKP